jgi:hypothetical protein
VPADAADLVLSFAQRFDAGMHRVAAEHKIVRMLGRRAQHEARLALRDELDGLLGGPEDGDLAGRAIVEIARSAPS